MLSVTETVKFNLGGEVVFFLAYGIYIFLRVIFIVAYMSVLMCVCCVCWNGCLILFSRSICVPSSSRYIHHVAGYVLCCSVLVGLLAGFHRKL